MAEDGVAPYKEVICIKADDLTRDDCILEAHYSPIPLTSEILERNGWIKVSGYWVLKGHSTRLGWRDGEMIVGYSALPEKIFYVHELQNLMKAVKISCNFEI